MNIRITPLLFLLLTFSCRSEEKKLFEITLTDFSDSNITLSEIADDIRYIPLDNLFPIGITYSLRIIGDNIYLSIKDIGIVQFDRCGKYLRNIGRKGRGPGEYRYGMDFTVDDENKRIYLVDNDKIKVYSNSGNFIRDFSYDKYFSLSANGIELINSQLFLPSYLLEEEPKYPWIILDTLGDLVSSKENSAHTFYPNMGIPGSTYKFDNKLFYFNLFNDTIFSISKDLKGIPAYAFSQNAHRRPEGGFGSDPWSQFSSLFIVTKMFETKSMIVLSYAYHNKGTILIINKTSKNIFLANKEFKGTDSKVYIRPCVINDIDGGLPLSLSIYYYFVEDGSEYICSLLNSFDIKTFTSGSEFKDAVPKYPEKKRELEMLSENLKETDNPVLMMVKLK